MEARRLRISGYVQGVRYRASMVEEARALGALGWVRNRDDGTVEAHVCGPQQVLAEMIGWARRGPPGAEVHEVLVEEEAPQPDLNGFHQAPTVE